MSLKTKPHGQETCPSYRLVVPLLFESPHWAIDLITYLVETFNIPTKYVSPVVSEHLCSLDYLLLQIQIILFLLL